MTRVCRACLQLIVDAECFNLNQSYPNSECCILRDRCKTCVPEMDLDLTVDAVLCGLCYNTFNLFYHLRLKCLDTEKKLHTILRNKSYIDLEALAQQKQAVANAVSNLYGDNGSASDDQQPDNKDLDLVSDYGEPAIKQECEDANGSVPDTHQTANNLDTLFDCVSNSMNEESNLHCASEDDNVVNTSTVEYKVPSFSKLNGSAASGSSADFMECRFNRLRSKKAFRCLDCDYSTSHRINLQNHIKSHFGNKPYKCNLCGYRALQKCFLKSHMMTHSGTKPFKCNQCDYKTAYRGNLQTHLRKHTGEKPYKCDICNNSYTQSNSLNRHIKTHANAKPLKCYMCEYRTMYKNHLRNHMMLHTGGKTYVCDICNENFSKKLELTNHMKNHDV